MDALTPLLIAKALDGLSLRAEATAANIANAQSPGYRAVRVTFEDRLRLAAGHGAEAVATLAPSMVAQPPSIRGGEMRVDLELATAAQTAMRYAALVDILGREMNLMRTAIEGGR